MSMRKKVTQGDLRKAMNEAKKKVTSVKKIESPLAKYTEAGQLMCILCKSIVRSEVVWPIHLNSKVHKENIDKAKRSVMAKESNPRICPAKRPISPSMESYGTKKVKGILKNTTVEKSVPNLPSDFFDNSSNVIGATSWVSEKSEIPKVEKPREGGTREAQEAKDETHAASLPEGFFDDPKMDAKVRNVDYKDPIEEEWDKFQKEIKEEAAQSAQIIADDQEEATTVRQLDEIEEQMRNWNRVMDFVKLKDQVRTSERKMDCIGNEESSDDDENYDEFLDWRAKNSYK
ncbi:zinc finger protein 830 [Venturia canescens]|uniref:zinc finger protein 830 n=1 Tax=Venturia canescens TaxID=32260 RepID=UPI001C9C64B3|nr:zinc finger protein 830 [Venturia canescens]